MKLQATEEGISPSVIQFVADTARVVAEGRDEYETTNAVKQLLVEALAGDFQIPEAYMKPREDRYVMYPLFVADDASFSIASAVWNIGQETPVHDHGVWGVVGILSGVEHEESFRATPSGALAEHEDIEFQPGEVTVCCTSDQDLHRVSASGDEPCVGIHVYGGDIGTIRRRSYRLDDGSISYFTSDWPIAPAIVEDTTP